MNVKPALRGRPRRMLVVLAAAALTLTACGGDGDGGATTPPAETTTPGETGGATVTITETDFAFDPVDITAGVNDTIVINNTGAVIHNFTIEGSPVDVDTEAGQSTTLEPPAPVDPGSYTVFCKYHRAQGMEGTIEVTA